MPADVWVNTSPTHPEVEIHLNAEILNSRFCLCPSGTGFGQRLYHVVLLGCVPVIAMHDGTHPPVVQAFEGEGLEWERFAVLVRREQIPKLPSLLAAVDLAAKQRALHRVWTRLIWRSALGDREAAALPGPDAFETLMEALRNRAQNRKRDNPRL